MTNSARQVLFSKASRTAPLASLQNALKHYWVRQFGVQLQGTSGEIQRAVKKSDVGFNVEAAKMGLGLGLNHMEERLKRMEGIPFVDSQPKRGTTILARVPLSSGNDSIPAAE
jgi:signal transduction histidine kinase